MPYPPELQKEMYRIISEHGGIEKMLKDWLAPGAMTEEDSDIVLEATNYLMNHRVTKKPHKIFKART